MPQIELLPPDIGPAEFASAFAVSRETADRLEIYAEALRHWQRTINLVAPATLETIWQRHFADSAQLLDLAPSEAETWLDLGSGAGFPGLVLALLLLDRDRKARMTLVESDQRKGAFLADVVRRTGLAQAMTVDILCDRVEAPATRDKVGKADVVTSRALAPMDRLLALAQPFFGPQTHGLFLKGRSIEAEMDAAAKVWRLDYDLAPSRTDRFGRIVVLRSFASRDGGRNP